MSRPGPRRRPPSRSRPGLWGPMRASRPEPYGAAGDCVRATAPRAFDGTRRTRRTHPRTATPTRGARAADRRCP
jgi:hypothetical protein